MKEIELQKLAFFTEGNTFTGECGKENGSLLRYLVRPDREERKLIAYAWDSDVCFEKAEEKAQQDFSLSEEGLEEIKRWLQAQLAER